MKECYEILERLSAGYSYKNIFDIMCSFQGRIAAEYTGQNGEICKITYGEYEQRAKAAAAAISKRLQQPGAVGIKLDNSPNWPTAVWGCLMAGHMPVLLDARGERNVTEHLLGQTAAVGIITEEEGYQGYTVMKPEEIFGGEAGDFVPQWEDRICLCTSGTTGTSKVYVYDGDAMSHQMMNAKYFLQYNGDIMYDASEGPLKNLAFLPLHHIFGFVAVYMWFSFFGKTIVYLADRNPKTIMETCKRHEVTHIFCVPMFWNSVAQGIQRKVKQGGEKKQKLFDRMSKLSYAMQSGMKNTGRRMIAGSIFKGVQNELVGGSVRFMISGGGHILPETLRIINSIGYPLYNGFGMTETGITSVELTYDIQLRLRGSVGVPFQSVEYRIDAKEGENSGELLIKGDSLHSGRMIDGKYEPRNKDEWFATGDIARLENGRLWLEGRLKEVIINESGENIYPDELEDYFVNLPGVTQHCVAGLNLGRPYEDIVMILELEPGMDAKGIAEMAEQVELINKALPMNKKLAKVYVSEKALPLANGIKVQRQKLKKWIEDGQWPYQELDLTLHKLQQPLTTEEARADKAQYDQRFLQIKEDIRKIFAEVLILDEDEIGDFDHFVTDLGGDSLSVIGVIAQLEEKYNLFIPDTEFTQAVNIHDIAELIYAKLYGEDEVNQPKKAEAPPSAGGGRITDFEQTEEWKAFQKRLEASGAEELNPYFVAHDSTVRDTSLVGGKEVINLGSYNYLGMSGHPETVRAAKEAIDKYGTSASGSRVLAGEKTLYQELEETIARWKHAEAAIVMTGGYATNLCFIGHFAGKDDLILYDALSHNSIVAGCQLSQGESKSFPHNDIAALEQTLKAVEGKYTKVLLVVEGVYSMDGDIAPIPEFVRLKKQYGAFLMVDEAHSGGVIGKNGGGVDEYFGLAPEDIDIKMGTLSKALGTCGGYIAGKKSLVDYLKYQMPGFVFTAGISPPLAAAAKRAIELLQEDPAIVQRLHDNIAYFVKGAKARGLDTILAAESAIVPVRIGSDEMAFLASHKMLERGVFVPPAVFPAVAKGQSRLRFSITAAHTPAQLEKALEDMEAVARELGILS